MKTNPLTYTSSRSSSNSDSEVDSCSKSCVKAYATLKEQYDNLNYLIPDYIQSQFNLASSTAASLAIESFMNSSEMLENQEYNKSKSDKGYHVVPPPHIGNFIPSKPDLIFIDEIVESENVDVTTVVTPSGVKKVVSNHESANNGDAVETNTGNPQQKEYKEKGVIDSGCSRHMTENKCYLTEYEDYDGGFVSFGDGNGRISRMINQTRLH
ncbi:hypothetical protein Tco_0808698 [Tanacetum coccineum]